MPKPKAHCFGVFLEDGNAVQVQDLLRAFAKRKKPALPLASEGKHLIIACEPHWPKAGGGDIFVATIFKVRRDYSPSVVDDQGPQRLEIPEGKGLGDAMCFAYDPLSGKALIYRALNGPGATTIASLLRELGFPHKVRIEPEIRPDMMERLARTHFVKRFVFSLKGVSDNARLSSAGAPVERAIELAGAVEATDIKVELSVGKRKEGLILDVVKQAAEVLHDVGGTNLGGLVVDASEAEGQACETLDLLNARIEYELVAPESTRELDRPDCQRQLAKILREVVPVINRETLF